MRLIAKAHKQLPAQRVDTTPSNQLTRHGLVEQRTIEGHSSYSTKVLTLTKDGHGLLQRAQLVSSRQATYHGLVKPTEARHDADLYRLYQKVSREIERSGGVDGICPPLFRRHGRTLPDAQNGRTCFRRSGFSDSLGTPVLVAQSTLI
jgi:hypothetical protein